MSLKVVFQLLETFFQGQDRRFFSLDFIGEANAFGRSRFSQFETQAADAAVSSDDLIDPRRVGQELSLSTRTDVQGTGALFGRWNEHLDDVVDGGAGREIGDPSNGFVRTKTNGNFADEHRCRRRMS